MKKASAKIRNKVKIKFCRAISRLEQQLNNTSRHSFRPRSKVDFSKVETSKKETTKKDS